MPPGRSTAMGLRASPMALSAMDPGDGRASFEYRDDEIDALRQRIEGLSRFGRASSDAVMNGGNSGEGVERALLPVDLEQLRLLEEWKAGVLGD